VDLDRANHKWHAIDGNIAPNAGASGLKQRIKINDVPERMPHHDCTEVHFVEKTEHRTEKSWEPVNFGRSDIPDQSFHASIKRPVGSLDLIEEFVQGTSLFSSRSEHPD
jgi:hypothetical protein